MPRVFAKVLDCGGGLFFGSFLTSHNSSRVVKKKKNLCGLDAPKQDLCSGSVPAVVCRGVSYEDISVSALAVRIGRCLHRLCVSVFRFNIIVKTSSSSLKHHRSNSVRRTTDQESGNVRVKSKSLELGLESQRYGKERKHLVI